MIKFAVVGLWIFALALPSFDIQAALWVGGVVLVAAAVVLVGAIVIPSIALAAGGTFVATTFAVAGYCVVVGVIAGVAAGFISGHIGDIKIEVRTKTIKLLSSQLHIKFEQIKERPSNAKPFECTIITYIPVGLNTQNLGITEKKTELKGEDAANFYSLIERQINFWQAEKVLGDSSNLKRRIIVYMDPFPGDSVFSRIAEIANKVGGEKVEIQQIFGTWKSAAPDLP